MRHASRSTAALAALGLGTLIPDAARAQTQDLFVANGATDTISRFAGTGPGTFSTTAATLTAPSLSGPTGLAFDAKGDLFAANLSSGSGGTGPGSITEFAAGAAPGTFRAATTLVSGLNGPGPLAVNGRGDLFVGNLNGGDGVGTIEEFAFNAATGAYGSGTTLAGGLDQPGGLAVDSRGDLFATSVSTPTSTGGNSGGAILEFAFNPATGTYGAGTAIVGGLYDYPEGLAFDPRGDLFLANEGHTGSDGVITEFAFNSATGTLGTGTTFASGLRQPIGLASDARGNVYAENYNTGDVSEFAFNSGTGTFGTARTIETGTTGGSEYLAIGPSASPVPEASQAVSLGLPLALGMGGAVAARKKRKA